jgi:hypothetical protein
MNSSRFPQARINPDSAIQIGSGAASLAFPRLRGSQSLYQIDTGQELRSSGNAMGVADGPLLIAEFGLSLETGMERDEDGVVLGSTRLSGSQRLHR